MKLTFLEATTPLTKTYKKSGSELVKTPYPHVYEVTSIEEQCADITSFATLIKKHAAKNRCLLKGNVTRPLNCESRAGSTDSTANTDWVCLDIDGLPTTTTVVIDGVAHTASVTLDDLLEDLGLKDTSYVVQYSASYGIENQDLRCHVFMHLDRSYSAPLLKQWLIQLNHTSPLLSPHISLTKTGNALRWPLDISACQNDKLLYIAPPVLKGLNDPMGSKPRIHLIKKKNAQLSISNSITPTAINKDITTHTIANLRSAAGMPAVKGKFKMRGMTEVMLNPNMCTATEIKQERGFVYFNLNGGDSWAYFHPEEDPDFIYNFKGEPAYPTKELLPDYWESLHTLSSRTSSTGTTYLAFIDPATDNYWRGTYDESTDALDLTTTKSSKTVTDFAKTNGIPLFDNIIPEWRMTFDPHDNVRVDVANKTINTFQPSLYMKAKAKPVSLIPKTIRKVIFHVCGEDDEVFERYINWLAYVLQERDRPLTAWIFHGVPGTGKGTLLNKILRPLFGAAQLATPLMAQLEDKFNSFLEKSLIVAVDEVEADAFQSEKGVMANLRLYITEENVTVRNMYQSPRVCRNYSAWHFFSNASAPVRITKNDRRFNVAKYQPNKLIMEDKEFEQVEEELQRFHNYLLYLQVDKDRVTTPLINLDREILMDLSESSIDEVSNALLEGDMEFFIDQLPTDSTYQSNAAAMNRVEDYKKVIKELLSRTDRADGGCSIARDELRAIYDYTVGKMPESPNKFTSLLKHHRMPMTKVRVGKPVTGVRVAWKDVAHFSNFDLLFAPPKTSKPVLVKTKTK